MLTRVRTAVTAVIAAGLLAGCAPPPDQNSGLDVGADVVSPVAKDEAVAALLPPEVREAGVLRFGSSIGSPPSPFHLPDNRTAVGLDIDITDAVARVLGVRVERQEAAFEAILPALGSGKFQVGTGNFGVTEERRKTIDFVTYIDDGQGFAVRQDSDLAPVTDIAQLCGRIVGTGAGTTFESTLNAQVHRCAEAGLPPYQVQVFSEQSASYSALRQGKVDVLMSTINGLRHATSQQSNLRFLNDFRRLDVGFALAKGSPLAPALQAAVNKLIADGTYQRILRKWGVEPSAIETSRISPPELR
ncbi:amino acid ABC transporter substrate-binding protein, PAAT family (TC 3.A.1.3.-) [Saccharopolyspora kobensis]|uniref:Amino acid ABC transporter substrate-binding protein, PAAT family n=1 Tax=Saccharopolyspora kobensis TaxID=146035 RepID=A0A1H5UGQ9_9PSEU|nr:amino acid ABC transporter substrate-binding protein, PAAT family (TC 3.A.1.3.-) [Saccharopolyspora kobensis]SFC73531.1 amino acid ABC transporter substrate-binding protein, PAAT family [Saccharopolyspora kobensis]